MKFYSHSEVELFLNETTALNQSYFLSFFLSEEE